MESKVCSMCKIEKSYDQFSKNYDRSSGLQSACKECKRNKRREYKNKNRDEINRKQREYIKKVRANGGPLNNKKQSMSEEEKKKKRSEYAVKYHNERCSKDPLYKLKISIRKNISGLFKRKSIKKNSKTEEMIGLSYEEFKSYIESLFQEGMSWENYGEWHIDHIIPVSSANSEEELFKLNNYQNLQPLWAQENLSKGDRY